jgi:hypothetical protein
MLVNFGIHPIWGGRSEIITNPLYKSGMLERGKMAELFFCVLTQSGPTADIRQPEKSFLNTSHSDLIFF